MKVIRRCLPRLFLVLIVTFLLSAVFFNIKRDRGQLFSKLQMLNPSIHVHVQLKSVLVYNASTHSTRPDDMARPKCNTKNSMVFIKTHKSGSTTLIATLQKYAYINNLLMMVPNVEHNMFDWPLEFRPNIDNVRAPNNDRFDMLVNHIIFNKSSIAPLMKPDAQYVTILREPLAHLRSAFQYFDLNNDNRLGKGVTAITTYLSNPFKYDKNPPWMKSVLPLAINRINSMTRNLQSADLGLSYWSFDKPEIVQKFVNQTMENFQFIVILERLEESLVLLRRHMCWKMQDIMFINKNINPNRLFEMKELPATSRANAYKWNNADLLLYQEANKRLDNLRLKEESVAEEIEAFKTIQRQISKHCFAFLRHKTTTNTVTIPAGRWNEEIVVDNRVCVLLLLDERDLTHVFKCKQHPQHKDCKGKSGARVNGTVSMIEGEVAYKYIPMTPRTR